MGNLYDNIAARIIDEGKHIYHISDCNTVWQNGKPIYLTDIDTTKSRIKIDGHIGDLSEFSWESERYQHDNDLYYSQQTITIKGVEAVIRDGDEFCIIGKNGIAITNMPYRSLSKAMRAHHNYLANRTSQEKNVVNVANALASPKAIFFPYKTLEKFCQDYFIHDYMELGDPYKFSRAEMDNIAREMSDVLTRNGINPQTMHTIHADVYKDMMAAGQRAHDEFEMAIYNERAKNILKKLLPYEKPLITATEVNFVVSTDEKKTALPSKNMVVDMQANVRTVQTPEKEMEKFRFNDIAIQDVFCVDKKSGLHAIVTENAIFLCVADQTYGFTNSYYTKGAAEIMDAMREQYLKALQSQGITPPMYGGLDGIVSSMGAHAMGRSRSPLDLIRDANTTKEKLEILERLCQNKTSNIYSYDDNRGDGDCRFNHVDANGITHGTFMQYAYPGMRGTAGAHIAVASQENKRDPHQQVLDIVQINSLYVAYTTDGIIAPASILKQLYLTRDERVAEPTKDEGPIIGDR